MSFSVEWHPVARRDLLSLAWRDAAKIDAAVMRFAAAWEGHYERVSALDPRRVRLFVPGVVAILFIDLENRAVHVGRVFRRA